MLNLLAAETPLFGVNERGILLFGFEIYFYAIGIVCGIMLATFLSALLMKRRNMSVDFIFTLFIVCIPSALLCTRLYYCITAGMNIAEWFSWKSIREGGLSVIGGVLGGVGSGLVVCLVKKVNFFRAADCVVVTILVAQAMGRWGNFFNMEVYGGEVASKSMEWFPFAVPVSKLRPTGIGAFSDPNATWHYAFFFYEFLLNLLGFGLLFTAAWFWTKKPNGVLMCGYFVWYGLTRSIMEPLRDPRYILSGGGVPWSLVTSILMIVGGLAGIGALMYFNYRKEGALVGSKKGDPCGITEYMTPYKDDVPYYSKINLMGKNYPPKPEKGEQSVIQSVAKDPEERSPTLPTRHPEPPCGAKDPEERSPSLRPRDSSVATLPLNDAESGGGDALPTPLPPSSGGGDDSCPPPASGGGAGEGIRPETQSKEKKE